MKFKLLEKYSIKYKYDKEIQGYKISVYENDEEVEYKYVSSNMLNHILDEFSNKYNTKDITKETIKYNMKPTIFHGYHGTKSDFDEFMYDFIGAHGVEHGFGFYFTSRPEIAQSYGNIIIEADLIIKHPLNTEKITITKQQVARWIKHYIDPTGEDFLSNYGDIGSESYNSILNEAIESLFSYNDNDVDILGECLQYLSKQTSPYAAYKAIPEIFGKDGIIYSGYDDTYGELVTNYIVFDNNQIINKTKIRKD